MEHFFGGEGGLISVLFPRVQGIIVLLATLTSQKLWLSQLSLESIIVL